MKSFLKGFFKVPTNEILNLMNFKILNYLAQLMVFKPLNSKTKEETTTASDLKEIDSQRLDSEIDLRINCGSKDSDDDCRIVRRLRKEMQVKVLSWILISIIDGLAGYTLLKGFNRVIRGDLDGHFKRIEIDEFFLLKPSRSSSSSSTTGSDQRLRGVLEKLSRDENKSMRNLQLISSIVNLPYLLSKEPLDALILIPLEIKMIV
ncbi:hypothetical protein PPACK8108_LOCUS11192 [Phakopsora pachyrhizi]|uniref:Uncharacterized protein n=1 Tax=Phakopsora pachyrhizi TaxID=170000 RepID=A0AAV0B1C9_PHAPC|nr:hypothetical protein PPACK8108_LOCUS11192 [Phakopsora pachyrhizi]